MLPKMVSYEEHSVLRVVCLRRDNSLCGRRSFPRLANLSASSHLSDPLLLDSAMLRGLTISVRTANLDLIRFALAPEHEFQ